jgi:hypothetical protein
MLCMQVRRMEKTPISGMVTWLAQRGPLNGLPAFVGWVDLAERIG